MVRMVFHSFCFACFLVGSVIFLFILKFYAASLCSNGWLAVKCIAVSVCLSVGFL